MIIITTRVSTRVNAEAWCRCLRARAELVVPTPQIADGLALLNTTLTLPSLRYLPRHVTEAATLRVPVLMEELHSMIAARTRQRTDKRPDIIQIDPLVSGNIHRHASQRPPTCFCEAALEHGEIG